MHTRNSAKTDRYWHFAGWAVITALAISGLGWLVIYQSYGGLPQTVVLHFDPMGRALGPRPRSALLMLPIIGLVAQPVHLGLSWLLQRRRLMGAAQVMMLGLISLELLLTGAISAICLR